MISTNIIGSFIHTPTHGDLHHEAAGQGDGACYSGRSKNTEPNRPNRTEPFNPGAGRGTEPERTMTFSKNTGRTTSNRKNNCQIEPNRNNVSLKLTEPNRIEPNRFLADYCHGQMLGTRARTHVHAHVHTPCSHASYTKCARTRMHT